MDGVTQKNDREWSAGEQGSDKIAVHIAPFIGRPFQVNVSRHASVDEVKRNICKRLRVVKDRICLLYRERQLMEGSLHDNCVVEGSRIVLLPRAETGLIGQKSDQSVMQALEGLSDEQVVDFLSGKAPLNLTMRLGDHMMLIQLQLSSLLKPESAAKNSQNPPSSAGNCGSSSESKSSRRTASLAEASRTLTQTLRQLSTEVMRDPQFRRDESHSARPTLSAASKSSESNEKEAKIPTAGTEETCNFSSGAIINSMHHHGKGVYSGTFSGTLNPVLQEDDGHPKRDITTIIHILNDLLCAQYKSTNKSNASASRNQKEDERKTGSMPNNDSNEQRLASRVDDAACRRCCSKEVSLDKFHVVREERNLSGNVPAFQAPEPVQVRRSSSNHVDDRYIPSMLNPLAGEAERHSTDGLCSPFSQCTHSTEQNSPSTSTSQPKDGSSTLCGRKRRYRDSRLHRLRRCAAVEQRDNYDIIQDAKIRVCLEDVTRAKVELLKKSMREARLRRFNRKKLDNYSSPSVDETQRISIFSSSNVVKQTVQVSGVQDEHRSNIGGLKSLEVLVEGKLDVDSNDMKDNTSDPMCSMEEQDSTSSSASSKAPSTSGDMELHIQA